MFKLIPPTGHRLKFDDLFMHNNAMSNYFKNYVSFNSGTSALTFLLMNLKIKQNSKIIIPAYSCPTVAAAVIKAGHIPVLCDVQLLNLGYNKSGLSYLIDTIKPSAIVHVNLFGLLDLIPKSDLPVILDNAQTILSNLNESDIVGTIYSFGRGKPINSMSGGLAVIHEENFFNNIYTAYSQVKNGSLKFEIKYLSNFVLFKSFFNPILYKILYSLPFLKLGQTTYNQNFNIRKASKLNNTVVNNILLRFDKITNMRKDICNSYSEIMKNYTDHITYFSDTVFHRYPVILKDNKKRDLLIDKLQLKGIGAFPLYPFPLNRQPVLKEIINDHQTYYVAELLSKGLFTLPINEFVDKKIISTINNIFFKVFQ